MRFKKFYAILCILLLLFNVVACSGKDPEHGDPDANRTVPEGSIVLEIDKDEGKKTVYGVGAELEPYFFSANVGRKGGSGSDAWECKAEDWDLYVVPRVKEMELERIRVMLLPSWFAPTEYSYETEDYTWDSENMQSLYKVLDLAQECNMDVNITLWGVDVEWMRSGTTWVTAPAEGKEQAFCDIFAAAIKYLREEKNYTCVNEVTPFNEPNGGEIYGLLGNAQGKQKYIEICTLLDETFRAEGIRDDVKFNLSDDAANPAWLSTTLSELEGVYDVVNSHTYEFNQDTTNEAMLETGYRTLNDYTVEIDEYNAIHMYGEFGTYNPSSTGSHSCPDRLTPERGLQIPRIAINMFNAGSSGFSYWVLFSQYYNPTTSEIMEMGLWGFADEGYTCRPVYYSYSLITRFVKKGTQIYRIPLADPNVTAVALRLGDEWTYLVVNDSENSKTISFLNDTKFPTQMRRYRYDQNDVPTDNQQIQSDGLLDADGRVLTDVLPPQTFAVYTNMAE